jgi:vacuolar-type H+-ATPase subunit D/Vma8
MSNINFEADQREDLDGANDANKLSEQVVKLQELEAELLVKEQEYKEMKRKVELVSSEVIPTMMQEMNISTLKLADGTSVEVKPVYGASIPADKKAS